MKRKYFVLGATASLAFSSCVGVFVSQQPARSESQAVIKSGTFAQTSGAGAVKTHLPKSHTKLQVDR